MIAVRESILSILIGGLLLLGGQATVMGQEGESDSDTPEDIGTVFKVVEQQPQLVGGLDTLQQMVNYPDSAKKAGVEGRVFLDFIVTKEGKVHDPQVIRGLGAGLDQEALRVIKKAKFKPGKQRGKPVNVRYSMPIIFRLQQ